MKTCEFHTGTVVVYEETLISGGVNQCPLCWMKDLYDDAMQNVISLEKDVKELEEMNKPDRQM